MAFDESAVVPSERLAQRMCSFLPLSTTRNIPPLFDSTLTRWMAESDHSPFLSFCTSRIGSFRLLFSTRSVWNWEYAGS
jgi:hypothetical protein